MQETANKQKRMADEMDILDYCYAICLLKRW
jgi:hypothetical protein